MIEAKIGERSGWGASSSREGAPGRVRDQDNLDCVTFRAASLRGTGTPVTVRRSGTDVEVIRGSIPHRRLLAYLSVSRSAVCFAPAHLRREAVRAHFTIGGHYASFEPALLFEGFRSSIRSFEGENTLLIWPSGSPWPDWRDALGIAFKDGHAVNSTRATSRTT
jgi:hypothetical protein